MVVGATSFFHYNRKGKKDKNRVIQKVESSKITSSNVNCNINSHKLRCYTIIQSNFITPFSCHIIQVLAREKVKVKNIWGMMKRSSVAVSAIILLLFCFVLMLGLDGGMEKLGHHFGWTSSLLVVHFLM